MLDKRTLVCYNESVINSERANVMKELKPKELRVFEYIKGKIGENGYAPSVREICAALNIKSTSTSQMYIDGAVHNYKVPLIGQVAAGIPILAAENYDGHICFSTEKKYDDKSLFALTVKGESMKEIGIMNGDIVVVEKCEYADNGKIVVAMVDDEATVKRFYKENGKYRLQPENKEMNPIIVDEVSILGQVVADIRFYK